MLINTMLKQPPPPKSIYLRAPVRHPDDLLFKTPDELKYYFPDVSPSQVSKLASDKQFEFYHPQNQSNSKDKLYKYLLDTNPRMGGGRSKKMSDYENGGRKRGEAVGNGGGEEFMGKGMKKYKSETHLYEK